jgi:hypothetical protein
MVKYLKALSIQETLKQGSILHTQQLKKNKDMYKRDLSKPLASTFGDPPKKKKSFGVLKSDANKPKKSGPKMEPGKKPFTKNGITYTWDRKNSVYMGDLKGR